MSKKHTTDDGAIALPILYVHLPASQHGPFIELMLEILIAEAGQGQHSQQTLDTAIDQCARLIPDDAGWVDASALHTFLEEESRFGWWCQRIALHSDYSLLEGHYRTQLPPFDHGRSTSEQSTCPAPFRVNTKLALKIALSSPTPRGDLLRRKYFDLETALNAVIDFDRISYLETLPMRFRPNGASVR